MGGLANIEGALRGGFDPLWGRYLLSQAAGGIPPTTTAAGAGMRETPEGQPVVPTEASPY